MENWKNLKYEGYEHYQVSDLGNVRGPKGFMKQRVNDRGYMMLGLRKKGKDGIKQKMWNVHRLVAEHFIEVIEGKDFVNHIDADKTNNCLYNLEWCNAYENYKHSFDLGLQKSRGGNLKPRKILIKNESLNYEKVFYSVNKAVKEKIPNCGQKVIQKCLKTGKQSYSGFTAKYI